MSGDVEGAMLLGCITQGVDYYSSGAVVVLFSQTSRG